MAEPADTVLVTGASGFVGKHVVVDALAKGYRVRGTIRRPDAEAEVRAAVAKIDDPGDRLSFARADLLSDAGWTEAADGCRYVIHIASPYPLKVPRGRDALVPVARDGTLRVLRAAAAADAERVVLTSSMAAIYPGQPRDRVLTEVDWANPDSPDVAPYARSKILAEKAAWDFMTEAGLRPRLAVINPGAIFGPALDRHTETSGEIVRKLLKGKYPAVPVLALTVVDVRDVAEMHVAALTHAGYAGGRTIAVSGSRTILEIGQIVGEAFPQYRSKMPRFILPEWLIKTAASFSGVVRAMVPELGEARQISGQKGARLLGRPWRSPEEAIVALARSQIELNLA